MNTGELEEALETKSLTALTKAIGKVADELGYQLKPPHTELLQLTSKEETEGYSVHFHAQLRLHYCKPQEGIVVAAEFGGDALAETPTPLFHDIFYAAIIEKVELYGYGTRWPGKALPTPREFIEQVEVPAPTINDLGMKDFLRILRGI
ncbi:MAG TPA: hypothetical protein VLV31_08200 [Candidatus Acidoferrales bacterium]|nr:hypothetical protein [Candidatus Acidoferrales bacterium]